MTLRLCLICHTKYEPLPELHEGGGCPQCGFPSWEIAESSDYRVSGVKKTEKPLVGSSQDYEVKN